MEALKKQLHVEIKLSDVGYDEDIQDGHQIPQAHVPAQKPTSSTLGRNSTHLN